MTETIVWLLFITGGGHASPSLAAKFEKAHECREVAAVLYKQSADKTGPLSFTGFVSR